MQVQFANEAAFYLAVELDEGVAVMIGRHGVAFFGGFEGAIKSRRNMLLLTY